VDNLEISHVSTDVVTSLIRMLDANFGREPPLTMTRGKKHDYLGVTIKYCEEGTAKISMVDYINTLLDELPEDMNGTSTTHAPNQSGVSTEA
jgi:hypothetical protein